MPKEIKGGVSQRRTVGDCGKNTECRPFQTRWRATPGIGLDSVPLILKGEFRGVVRLRQDLIPGMGRRHCRMLVRGVVVEDALRRRGMIRSGV